MNTRYLDKWASAAWTLEEPSSEFPVPQPAFLEEVAAPARVYWDRPPVEASAATAITATDRFKSEVRKELLELVDAFQSVESWYDLAKTEPVESLGETARELINVLRKTLGWYFATSADAVGDARLEKLSRRHDAAYSHDALAVALCDYASLAERYADRLAGVRGFDPARIDHARDLARELRGTSGHALAANLP